MTNSATKECPQCGAPIDAMAAACKYCGAEIAAQPQFVQPPQPPQYPAQYGQPQPPQYNPQSPPPYMPSQPPYAPPQYGQPPQAPYTPYSNTPIKSKTTAGLLGIFLGGIGVHKFYLGKTGMGILYLLLCWTYIPAIVGFIEGIVYLASSEEKFQMKYVKR